MEIKSIHSLYITGNEVDQLFSCLAKEFKSEILTIEDLKEKIVKAPITPKPICCSLLYIFGWNAHITDYLADPPLKNHSRCNSFLLSLESGSVKLRGKKLPQHTELFPRPGIRLVKENVSFGPVGPANFRIEKIRFQDIFKGLRIFLPKLPLERRMSIQTSWDGLRETLEGLPRRSANLQKMVISNFPKQTQVVPAVPEHLVDTDETHEELTGDIYPDEILEGHFIEDEVEEKMDVCIYTKELRGRPWVGRVVKINKETKTFLLQWYTRKTVRSKVFRALNNPDGSPSLSEVENQSVMFWMMSDPMSRTETSFSLTEPWLRTIQLEYETIDE